MNKPTFPPKGKLPQFSNYLASYQIISWLKQGTEHKTFVFKFENFNGIDSYGNSTSWKKLLDNKLVLSSVTQLNLQQKISMLAKTLQARN